MRKNTMKSTRVVILIIIMLAFVQILETKGNKLDCVIACAIECLPPNHYYFCFKDCVSKKCQKSTGVSNCARSCGVNKTITVDIGI